jgi:flagellar biosynthetic protein FliR
MLAEQVAAEAFALLLLFVRIGAALMLMPGFGEPFVLSRFRLLLAGLVSLALLGPLGGSLPAVPAQPGGLAALVGAEALIGLFIGVAARMVFAALHVAGAVIAMQAGLAAATMFDPSEATQGSLPGSFLTTTALVLLFATDAHHQLLRALAGSYAGLPPGAPLPLGDMADFLARLLHQAFAAGLQIAAPMLVIGLLMYLLMGVLNRLMPTFQVFFIAVPLQLLVAFAVMMLSLAGGLAVLFGLLDATLAAPAFGG